MPRHFAPRSTPSDAAALKQEGNGYFKKGQYEEAAVCYTAAIDLWMDPADRATLYSNRAAARLKLSGASKWQLALSDAQSATGLVPTNAKAHFRVGQAFRKLGRPAEAVEALRRMLQLVPGDTAGVEELRLATAEAEEQERRRAAAAAAAPPPTTTTTPKPSPSAAPAGASPAVPVSTATETTPASVPTLVSSVGGSTSALAPLPSSPMWSLPPVSVSDRAADLGRVLQRVADRSAAPREEGDKVGRREEDDGAGGAHHVGVASLAPSEWMRLRGVAAAAAADTGRDGGGAERWPTWWRGVVEKDSPKLSPRGAPHRPRARSVRRRAVRCPRGAVATWDHQPPPPFHPSPPDPPSGRGRRARRLLAPCHLASLAQG